MNIDHASNVSFSENAVFSPKSILKKPGSMNGHVVEGVTESSTQKVVAAIGGQKKSVRINLDLNKTKTFEKRSLLESFEDGLQEIEENTHKKIERLKADNPNVEEDDFDVEMEELAIHQDAILKIINHYDSFLKKLDKNPSLKNTEILLKSADILQKTLSNVLPYGPEQITAFRMFFQKLYPRLRNEIILSIEQLKKSPVFQVTEDHIFSLAKQCCLLIQIGLKNFDPQNFEPIKTKNHNINGADSLMERLDLPFIKIPFSSSETIDQKDQEAFDAIYIADSMIRNINHFRKKNDRLSPEEFCQARIEAASLDTFMARVEAKKILKKLKATIFCSSPENADKDPFYQGACADIEICLKMEKAQNEEKSNNSFKSNPIQIQQIALAELRRCIFKSVDIADDAVAALKDRERNHTSSIASTTFGE